MDEIQIIAILNIVNLIMLGFALLGACLYAIPLCFIRQFHKPVHFLTLNVCITALTYSAFWIIFFTLNAYYPFILWNTRSCLPIVYVQNTATWLVFYALCVVSLNRLFSIVYKNKALFRTNKWAAICVSAQWIFVIIIPLPVLASNSDSCLLTGPELIYRIYLFCIAIVVPVISLIITNSVIFIYAHRSTRRVQPTNGDSAQAPTLSPRDARLLKHMIFMFLVFFCGWAPIYIIRTAIGTADGFSPIILQIFLTVPTVALLIVIGDLFSYNHELRKYFTNQRQMNPNSQQN